jgi:hypothetical protein
MTGFIRHIPGIKERPREPANGCKGVGVLGLH